MPKVRAPSLPDMKSTRDSMKELVGRGKDKKAAMLWWDSFDEGAEFGPAPPELQGAAATGDPYLDIDFSRMDKLLEEEDG